MNIRRMGLDDNDAAMRALLVLLSGNSFAAQVQRGKYPADDVSPYIGVIGQLLTATVSYVLRRHGIAHLAPIATPGT
jgi:hypothetical protein